MQARTLVRISVLTLVCISLMASMAVRGGAEGKDEPSALLIELLVEARDTVPLSTSHQAPGSERGAAWVEMGKGFIHPLTFRRLHRTDAGKFNLFPHQTRELAEARIVLVVTRTFLGQFRRRTIRTMSLRTMLPEFPKRSQAASLIITPFGTRPDPDTIIPWPNFEWTIANHEDTRLSKTASVLVLSGGQGDIRLQPGGTHRFSQQRMTLPVTLIRFKPAKVGDTGDPEPQEINLGIVEFSADVTIRFHGELPLEVAE